MLLTARSRAAKKGAVPHPYYGRRLLTQRLLNQHEREASIKPTAIIGVNKGLHDAVGGGKKRALYLNDTRTVSYSLNGRSFRNTLSDDNSNNNHIFLLGIFI